MKRNIVGFELDSESHWTALLSCGHRQHTRHVPPLSERPWVLTSEGRASRIGTELDCLRCDRSEMPDGYEAYRRTPEFDAESVPKALTRRHSTKPGVWARIRILEGELEYHVHEPYDRVEPLSRDREGIVLPEVEHHVTPIGAVSFFVEFWRQRRDEEPKREPLD